VEAIDLARAVCLRREGSSDFKMQRPHMISEADIPEMLEVVRAALSGVAYEARRHLVVQDLAAFVYVEAP
jgi:hypothetical protein